MKNRYQKLCSATLRSLMGGGCDICSQTLLLLLKCANHRNKTPLVSTANEALVGALMTIGSLSNDNGNGNENVTNLHI